jgi:glycosyltransferase involved in cell wall biosynthesis/SAM-dependent methyltransferase
MRLAFFSPLPPVKSGIADYSAALLEPLKKHAETTVFAEAPRDFQSSCFDAILYQIGNNPHHSFVYDQAMKAPGVLVLHEANLHHLIADVTIRRDEWDAYLREVEFDGGAAALDYALKHVRTLERGPDYDGVPMLRRILSKSRGVIVHSHCVEQSVRAAGFEGPIAVIPHGAWLPDNDGFVYRERLGIDPATPLIGIFGFLKPYKRIAESLRAFRRLLKLVPNAKMILVGEPHVELPLSSLIQSLGLGASVRVIGFAPIDDFVGYLAACDVVLNLRFPTVGESSGTLLRSLGLGKAVVISNIGSFAEYPDDICLKVPVDATEEDTLFEYLNLLATRVDLRKALGDRARRWVKEECNWNLVASRYAAFVQSVMDGTQWQVPAKPAETAPQDPTPSPVEMEYVIGWAADPGAREYITTHISRLTRTLEITPRGGPGDRILEMGAYLQITPALKTKLGYGEVRGCYYGPAGTVTHKSVQSEFGDPFECDIDLFDAEKDPFPYPDNHFSTVLCCELLEHLPGDPMHMMAEINRILRPGGHLVLTTPNIVSFRAMAALLLGFHPGFFPAYIRPSETGEEVDARHNREYAPREIANLMADAGFEVTLLETGEFLDAPGPEHNWVRYILERCQIPTDLRGDGIYAVGCKQGPVRERFPKWLYCGKD